jgi:hypothetical protein
MLLKYNSQCIEIYIVPYCYQISQRINMNKAATVDSVWINTLVFSPPATAKISALLTVVLKYEMQNAWSVLKKRVMKI